MTVHSISGFFVAALIGVRERSKICHSMYQLMSLHVCAFGIQIHMCKSHCCAMHTGSNGGGGFLNDHPESPYIV